MTLLLGSRLSALTGLTRLGQLAVSSNRGAAYDLVLLAHVLAAFVAFAVVGVAGVSALQVRRPGEPSSSLARYYRPGVNWVGRTLFLVPILGVVLIAMSHGAWSFSDHWITLGLVLWAAAACAAEMMLWPAERRLQQQVTGEPADHESRRTLSLQIAAISATLLVIFVVATVVMVSKP